MHHHEWFDKVMVDKVLARLKAVCFRYRDKVHRKRQKSARDLPVGTDRSYAVLDPCVSYRKPRTQIGVIARQTIDEQAPTSINGPTCTCLNLEGWGRLVLSERNDRGWNRQAWAG